MGTQAQSLAYKLYGGYSFAFAQHRPELSVAETQPDVGKNAESAPERLIFQPQLGCIGTAQKASRKLKKRRVVSSLTSVNSGGLP
ncbi:hypothetical protein [Rheinheimera sp.]|uniref:hypothetical protein n=1 Tax=Rheinheimera sp. TaxID=1869214 RepID=UPI00307ECD61